MSLLYRDSQGNESHVAGLNGTSGELVPSVSLYKSGSFTASEVAAGKYYRKDIAFDTPMPDTDYQVSLATSNSISHLTLNATLKTVNGFSIIATNLDSSTQGFTCQWQAFKLMTDTVHEADEAQIAQNTLNFASAFSESTAYSVGQYVTYAGKVYKCTTAHSAGAWNASHFGVTTVSNELDSVVDKIYPIGSIYTSVNSTNPSTLFSGTTWEQLQDRFLLGAGSSYSAGATGGEASHVLTTSEMPTHHHYFSWSGTHNHTRFSTTGTNGWSREMALGDSGYYTPVTPDPHNNAGSVADARITVNGDTGDTGSNSAHNNMPPYLVVYMWKRTA